jgi:hypothetical protein
MLKTQFQDWNVNKVAKHLRNKNKLDEFKIDIRLSVAKPHTKN